MATTSFRKRGDLSMSKKQYGILCQLRDAHDAGQPLVKLEIKNKMDERTLKIMQRDLDWIIESWKVFGERRFSITSRGLKAMAKIEGPATHQPAGEMCFQCGEKPRYVSPGGHRNTYCQECANANKRALYAVRGKRYDPDLICSRCQCWPRDKSKGGHVYAYCRPCRNAVNDASRLRRVARAKEAAANGTLPTCSRCQNKPIHFTERQVGKFCLPCANEEKRLGVRRKAAQRIHERLKAK